VKVTLVPLLMVPVLTLQRPSAPVVQDEVPLKAPLQAPVTAAEPTGPWPAS
jgi:hypothetical protein